MTDRLLYTIPAVTEATGLPRTTVYNLMGKGVLEGVKAGRRTLIKADSVKAYVATLEPAQIRPAKAAA
jgi:excisionase family DNA binding protein